MNITRQLDQLESAAHVYAMVAGDDVHFLWGDDKEHLIDRMAAIRLGLIAANLDPEVIRVDGAKLRGQFTTLAAEIGHEHIHFLTDPA